MAIELPRLREENGLSLTVCGRITGGSGVETVEPRIAHFERGKAKGVIRACRNQGPKTKSTHLHVDCALRSFFGEQRVPKATHDLGQVLDVIQGVVGLPLVASVTGVFKVPLSALPEGGIIRSLGAETRAGDLSMKLTGGTLSLKGAPIKRVSWHESGEGNELSVWIRVVGEQSFTVSSGYLTEAWAWVSGQYAMFVLGTARTGNGQ
ncbi:MAG TPA: hypothetical protein ENN87_10290 [Phycisphaerales bacterium]|nr:hypothetical protein [Phycisphaerales bacterium]